MEIVNIPVDADLNFLVLMAKTKDDDGDDVGSDGVVGGDGMGGGSNGDECAIDGLEVGTAG